MSSIENLKNIIEIINKLKLYITTTHFKSDLYNR